MPRHPQEQPGQRAAGPAPQDSGGRHAARPDGRDAELAAILPRITGPDGHFGTASTSTWPSTPAGVRHAPGGRDGLRLAPAADRLRGAPQKYHQTVSRAWVELVAHHVAADPGCADFAVFAERNPALLDKRLLARHYRSSTLAAPEARHDWVEPDLQPFPGGRLTFTLVPVDLHPGSRPSMTVPAEGGNRVELLTIGAFARASRLSPKALRFTTRSAC